jgi:hypothetical protein
MFSQSIVYVKDNTGYAFNIVQESYSLRRAIFVHEINTKFGVSSLKIRGAQVQLAQKELFDQFFRSFERSSERELVHPY